MVSHKKPIPLLLDTHLAVIRNSVGSKMFREYCAMYEGKRKNIVEGGDLSCAYFVSFVLKGFDLIDAVHLTVDGTMEALQKQGWKEIKKPKSGAVLVWVSQEFDDGPHKHIGFAIGNNKAVSTSYKTQTVVEHSADFDGQRPTENIFWHKKLK